MRGCKALPSPDADVISSRGVGALGCRRSRPSALILSRIFEDGVLAARGGLTRHGCRVLHRSLQDVRWLS